ncbi:LLM class flavin-dependent oxidoreductase [Thermoleophilia bacterium SCSIO 60948]|nr:LLM class flavin-dependent oxidoreductase [Thermoleophilia bacterium SCSIO 60948]
MEVWLHAFAFPGRVEERARWAERTGFDGMLVADSQNLTADVWMELALAARATARIKLGTGVTNPATRHPAVTASAAATLQAESGGRAVLGLGRGDSALAKIGRGPVHVGELESAVVRIQAFLAGESADLDGFASQIAWIASSQAPKVPLHVAATGPHVIGLAARLADAIELTVGAEVERLRWALGVAREAVADPPPVGAFLNVGVADDASAARDLVRGSTAIFARFATEGAPETGLSTATREGVEALASDYDETRHGEATAPHARALGDEFIDRFAVAGEPDEVAERLREIAALGIGRLVLVPGSLDAAPEAMARSDELLATEVLPRLRS